jgi:hypothetical protein
LEKLMANGWAASHLRTFAVADFVAATYSAAAFCSSNGPISDNGSGGPCAAASGVVRGGRVTALPVGPAQQSVCDLDKAAHCNRIVIFDWLQ